MEVQNSASTESITFSRTGNCAKVQKSTKMPIHWQRTPLHGMFFYERNMNNVNNFIQK